MSLWYVYRCSVVSKTVNDGDVSGDVQGALGRVKEAVDDIDGLVGRGRPQPLLEVPDEARLRGLGPWVSRWRPVADPRQTISVVAALLYGDVVGAVILPLTSKPASEP